MSWNLFEKIINAFRPAGKAPEPQSWPESSADQPQNKQQQQPSQAEEMVASTQQNEPSGQDSQQKNW